MLHKTKFSLELLSCNYSTPIKWGAARHAHRKDTIYVDNGSDFHSAALARGCAQHGIQIEYRPLGKAHYGGIVERALLQKIYLSLLS